MAMAEEEKGFAAATAARAAGAGAGAAARRAAARSGAGARAALETERAGAARRREREEAERRAICKKVSMGEVCKEGATYCRAGRRWWREAKMRGARRRPLLSAC
jgi:hypothetical protein